MSQGPYIPQDDLMDVAEMTEKLESLISSVLKENELNLALSALMSASINCILAQCSTLKEVIFYKNLLIKIFDNTIKTINIREDESSSSSS